MKTSTGKGIDLRSVISSGPWSEGRETSEDFSKISFYSGVKGLVNLR